MAKEHRYRLETAWTGNRGTGTSGYTAYGREHEIRAEFERTLKVRRGECVIHDQ